MQANRCNLLPRFGELRFSQRNSWFTTSNTPAERVLRIIHVALWHPLPPHLSWCLINDTRYVIDSVGAIALGSFRSYFHSELKLTYLGASKGQYSPVPRDPPSSWILHHCFLIFTLFCRSSLFQDRASFTEGVKFRFSYLLCIASFKEPNSISEAYHNRSSAWHEPISRVVWPCKFFRTRGCAYHRFQNIILFEKLESLVCTNCVLNFKKQWEVLTKCSVTLDPIYETTSYAPRCWNIIGWYVWMISMNVL
jgi:hypothetical protein